MLKAYWTVFFTSFLTSFAACLSAQASACKVVPGEFILRLKNSSISTMQKQSSELSNVSFKTGAQFDLIGQSKKKTNSINKLSSEPLMHTLLVRNLIDPSELSAMSGFLSVEPNCWVENQALPNDAHVAAQWGLSVISASEAWQIKSSAENIVVAVSDSGVDLNHEDLKGNIWINQKEVGGQAGIDDDGNGYIDDFYGYDFADNDNNPNPGQLQGSEHGTHVAGILGAIGNNNLGVSGVAWKVQIMVLKGFRDSSMDATLADLLKTIYYAVDNGAQVINASWGTKKSPSPAEFDAVNYALDHNVVIVAAAGNFSEDAALYSPANIPGVITVGSINSQSYFSTFSNFGNTVKILAPGGDSTQGGGLNEGILSTIPTSKGLYGSMRGTSMAAPFVAGAVALIKATNPMLAPADILQLLQETGDTVEARVAGYASPFHYPKLNLRRALSVASGQTNDCLSCGQSNLSSSSEGSAISDSHPGFGGGCQMSSHTDNAQSGFSFWMLLIPLALWRHYRRKDV